MPEDRMGDWALSFGIAAFVCAFLPVIGELIAVPTGPLAILLGLVAVRKYETGRATRVVPAIAGAVLGASAVMVSLLVLIATEVSP